MKTRKILLASIMLVASFQTIAVPDIRGGGIKLNPTDSTIAAQVCHSYINVPRFQAGVIRIQRIKDPRIRNKMTNSFVISGLAECVINMKAELLAYEGAI